jgi:hypothetical protein
MIGHWYYKNTVVVVCLSMCSTVYVTRYVNTYGNFKSQH